MAYRQDWIRLIRTLAAKYGVDPRAALAVASSEGLSGAVGDQGTSFGPFQLHVGGALPSGRGRAWAESPAGLDYAMRQIAGVSKGLTGQQAISNIVNRFERPANPRAEVARALLAYSQFGGGAVSSPSPASAPAQDGQPINAQQLIAQKMRQQFLAGGAPDFAAVAQALQQRRQQRVRAVVTPSAPAAAKGGSFVDPAKGKVIGLPYQGTHRLGNWESDRAVDVAVPSGTPIYAPFDGVIGTQFGSLGKGGRFAGLRVHVVGANNEWYGGHLSRFAAGIKPGMRVRAGQVIGYSGSASGVAHLHEALRRGDPRSLIR